MSAIYQATQVIKSTPDIIKAASSSPLGVFALMIIIIGGLAFAFFKTASNRTKVGIFLAMFVGVVLYGVAISRASQPTPPGTPTEALVSVDGVIVNANGGFPVPLATVATAGGTGPATTDDNGIFHLRVKTQVTGEPIELRVSKEGFATVGWTVTPPIPSGLTIPLSKLPSGSQAASHEVTTEVYKSDLAASGACKDFGSWSSVCSADKPEGWTITSQTFALTGDRAGCAYAECLLVSPPTATKVCYRFRTQGHDEECGHSGNTGIHYSQGVLTVVWQHP